MLQNDIEQNINNRSQRSIIGESASQHQSNVVSSNIATNARALEGDYNDIQPATAFYKKAKGEKNQVYFQQAKNQQMQQMTQLLAGSESRSSLRNPSHVPPTDQSIQQIMNRVNYQDQNGSHRVQIDEAYLGQSNYNSRPIRKANTEAIDHPVGARRKSEIIERSSPEPRKSQASIIPPQSSCSIPIEEHD